MKKIIVTIASLVLAISFFSCAGPTQKERGAKTGAVIGAASGAAAGGIAGYQIDAYDAYMDKQEQELKSAMAANEAASIQRTQDVLTATFRSEYLFDFDASTLKPGAYSEIGRVADVLNRYPQTTIRIEGHTDSKGSEAYNQTLSEKRALAVKRALTQRGVDPTRIQTVGFGKSQPISSDHAMNRRVVIVIMPT